MRLKSFDAQTMSEAMNLVRETFGEDAVIVSTFHLPGGGGVRVTAASETPDEEFTRSAPAASPAAPPAAAPPAEPYAPVTPPVTPSIAPPAAPVAAPPLTPVTAPMATTGSPATGPAPWLAAGNGAGSGAGNGADTAPVRANGADSKAAAPAVGTEPVPGDSVIAEALAYHGLPRALIDRLAADGDDPQSALTGALKAQFRFEPLGNHSGVPLALVGPAGAGKTVALAKLAARATLANLPVKVISADGFRAGGIDQLAAFTDILGIELHTAGSPRELERLAAPGETQGLILIDTAGVNPFSKADMLRLVELIASVDAEPVLTLAAGGDPGDAGETGEIFAAIGARRQIVTRLDAVRRLGGVLASAERGNLGFCDIGMSPHVSRGLRSLDAPSLARLLLCHQPPEKPAHLSNEAQ